MCYSYLEELLKYDNAGTQLLFDGSKNSIYMDTNHLLIREKAALRVGSVDCAYTNKVCGCIKGIVNL